MKLLFDDGDQYVSGNGAPFLRLHGVLAGVVAWIARRSGRLVEIVNSCTEPTHAEQTQHLASPPHCEDEVQGDELGRARRGSSASRQPDLVGHQGSDRRVVGRTPVQPWWTGHLFGPGHRGGSDAAPGVSSAAAPNARAVGCPRAPFIC